MNLIITDNKENHTIVVQHEDEIIDRYPYEQDDFDVIAVMFQGNRILVEKTTFIESLEAQYKDKT